MSHRVRLGWNHFYGNQSGTKWEIFPSFLSCFHEVKLASARQEQTATNSFELLLDIDYQKTGASARGQFNDLLEIGFYNSRKELSHED